MNSLKEILQYSFSLDQNSGSHIYRGQTNHEWQLIPSVYRRFKRYQAVILEAFLLYIHRIQLIEKPHIYTNHPIEFLALCQHYEIPTRLLDWTYNLPTAIYFACEDVFDKYGKKIEVDGAIHLCEKKSFNKFSLDKFRETTNELLIVETNITNPRMNSQSGCFILWGVIPLHKETTESYNLGDYCNNKFQENPLKKIIIPKENKANLLRELNEMYGINKDRLYINNEYSQKLETQYRIFRKVSSIITHEMTNWELGKSLFKMNFNLGGCLNLQSLPEDPGPYSDLILAIINYQKDLVGRNEFCVCRSGKKYKKCCGK